MKSVLQLENIGKHYGSTVALSDVSLQCSSGIVGILGPNGAGKSTLIKILMGLIKPSTGTGNILGHPIDQGGRKIRSIVGYMPEDDCYIAGLTGIEMVRFSANLAGLPFVEGLRRSHEILDFCAVGQERYRQVDTYSTGMRQKIKFAASIVHDPQLLILDEPTSGLDPEERLAMLSRFRVLARDHGKSILLSTHILPDVQNVCDNVVIIANGRVRISESLEVLNKTASPAIHLRLFGEVETAVNEMWRQGFQVEVARGGKLIISSDEPDLASKIWEICTAHQFSVHSMVPGKTSLEEVFIQTVRGKDANS